MTGRYDTNPSQQLRDRAVGEIADIVGCLGLTDRGRREVLRMAFTLGAIERVLDEVEHTGDEDSAAAIARMRARMDAYGATSEVPR